MRIKSAPSITAWVPALFLALAPLTLASDTHVTPKDNDASGAETATGERFTLKT